jgi:uncharacterized membrane protein HdeD (DUF308 family)
MTDGWTERPRAVVTPAGEPSAGYLPAAQNAGVRRGGAIGLGLTSVLAGVLVVVWPEATVAVVAVLLGLQLLVYGVVRIVQSFVTEDAGAGERILLILLGLLSIVVGVLCLRNLLQTVTALTLLVGLFWLAGGLIEIVRAVAGRSGLDLATGLLGTLAGIVVLSWPRPTVLVLAVLFGTWLVLFGAIGIVSALRRPQPRLA